MHKLTYKGQFVKGFDEDQVVGNLAQLLNLKPKVVRLAFLSGRPSVIKVLDSSSEVERWCAAFQDAGVYLDVADLQASEAANIADQIELELELHSLDQDEDEPEERNYLVRKLMKQEFDDSEEEEFSEPEAKKPQSETLPLEVAEEQKTQQIQKPQQEQKPQDSKPVSTSAEHIPPVELALHELSVSKIDAMTRQLLATPTSTPIVEEVQPEPESAITKAKTVADDVDQVSAKTQSKKVEEPKEEKSEIEKPEIEKPKQAEKRKTQKAEKAKGKAKPEKESLEKNLQEQETHIHEKIEKESVEAEVDVKKAAAKKTTAKVLSKKSKQATEEQFESNEEPRTVNSPASNVVALHPAKKPGLQQTDIFDDEESEIAASSEMLALRKHLEQEAAHEKTDDAEDEEVLDLNFHKSYFVWGMLTILVAIIATAGTIFWLKRSNWTPVNVSAQELKINDAIASANLVAMVHVDLERLQGLSATAANSITRLPGPEINFWKNLAEYKMDLSREASDAWLAVYDQNKIMWVLQGTFAESKWKELLKKNYTIDGDNPDSILFSAINENACDKRVLSASIKKDQIVIGAPELVAAFNGRLQAAATADKNLGEWTKAFSSQMASAVLFQPGQLPNGLAANSLGKLALPVEPVQGIYLGLEPKTFPPRIEFEATLAGDNAQFASDATQKLSAAVNAAKTGLVADWPETSAFYENLRITQDETRVRAKLNLDEDAPQQIYLLLASLMSRVFAPDVPATAPGEEQIEGSLTAFVSLPSSELPAFSRHFNEAFIAQTSSGPFGIGVSDIEQTDQGVAIKMDINAFNLPNLAKENDSVFLQINDIVDHQDQTLIAGASSCASDIRQQTPINVVYQGSTTTNDQQINFTGLQGTKTIVLPAEVGFTNVGAVKGVIKHKLPTEIDRVKIKAPFAGKKLDLQSMHFRFLSADAHRVYFQVSGDLDKLLHVNALNENGNVLVNTSIIRTENAFDGGKIISMDFQGKVAEAELVVASKLEEKNYEFSIARLFPSAKPFSEERSMPKYLAKSNLVALEKDTPPNDVTFPTQTPRQTISAGPALIALNDLSIAGQHLTLVADVYTRNTHPLANQLGALRLAITEVEDSAGNLHSVNIQAPVGMAHMGGNWVNGKYEPDPGRPWLHGPLEIRDRPLEQGDVVAFWGKLVFSSAEDPVSIKIPFHFGMQWNSNEGVLKLRRWEENRLIFDVEGNFPELMAVKALDGEEKLVSQPAELQTAYGKNTIELEIKQIPETIEFNIARTQSSKEFPLEIRVQ